MQRFNLWDYVFSKIISQGHGSANYCAKYLKNEGQTEMARGRGKGQPHTCLLLYATTMRPYKYKYKYHVINTLGIKRLTTSRVEYVPYLW